MPEAAKHEGKAAAEGQPVKVHIFRVLSGPAGTAHEQFIEFESSDQPDHRRTVASWFIRAPRQWVAWDCYLLSVVHLRPVKDAKPAVILESGATHEFLLVALDPGKQPRAGDPKSWFHVTPMNLEQQLRLPSDETAAALLAWCAREVVEGRLWAEPPLSGMVEPWRGTLRTMAEYGQEGTARGGAVEAGS